ncbi:hypothetical protein [Microbacterium sp. SORGH_AS_0888]|uniref:hypothetical protein n=1 Tax=Microbacterium sp. SORGH_AS_0888 TaxID=3041791 RepID=UPI00277DB069|nr:hypothetical protein [Microbacterium sp. SORGH_AS_0888]MDQ1128388.1 hypothetical protein [Microbacterium sp. SORGH_AS_0888]
MRVRLILLALVGAAAATAVVGAVLTTMPRPAATGEASAIEETAAHLPGVALDDQEATVKRFLGYENAPVPSEPPVAPWVPRSGGSDHTSSDAPESGSDGRGTSEPAQQVPPPSTPTPSPDPTSPSPTPSPTPSPEPTDGNGASPAPGGSESTPPSVIPAPPAPSEDRPSGADDIHSVE